MSDTIVKLKTIADLQNESAHFLIDAYQRGYRWTVNEVRDLLDDIREFSHTKRPDDNTFYCLQPIIVTQAEDGISWKVIDGQQRLTTIYLIYSFYWVIAGNAFMRDDLPFDLSYSNKPKLAECLRIFTEKEFASSGQIDQVMPEYENDIDCYYVLESYKCICDYFLKLRKDPYTRNEITDMKKVFDTFMKIIWYEITDCDVSTEVAVFSKINMGKIALTNAELIKALLLKKDGNDSDALIPTQTNIAVKWDEIEAQLSEDGFWSFLVNETDETAYATRIDFIFHVMARELNDDTLLEANKSFPNEESYTVSESVNKDKFSFYVFSNYVRLLQKHPAGHAEDDQNYIDKIWDGVCEYYRMFKDWYKNIHWYHMIGFLVETSSKQYIDQILELSRLYREGSNENGEGHKEYFERRMRERISKTVFGGDIPTRVEYRDYIDDLNYDHDADDIRKTLLLYNISYLEACQENGRFPFEKYKNHAQMWDIEHINAVSDTRPDDDRRDSDDNNRLQWLKKATDIPEIEKIVTADGQPVLPLIHTITDNKYYLAKYQENTRDFIQVYEAVINYFGGAGEADHSIGNLTLLDSSTNRSYKNDVFPLKRKTILERTLSDVFIPLCTRKVFMKGFAESGDLLRWREVDKKAYTEEIINCICNYLKLEDADNEQ